MPVGAQRVGQYVSVAAVVLGAGDGEPIAKAVELLGVDRIDSEAALQQSFDQRPARRLDCDRDLRRLCGCHLDEPGAQL
jgi:hypothetical protein